MKIEIKHTGGELSPEGIEATLDGNTITHPVFFSDTIILSTDADLGMHVLTVTNKTDHAIDITDVKINGSSLRDTIYLSHVVDGDKTVQPCTCIYKKNLTWYLPFCNPVSAWTTIVMKKLGNGMLGKDLHKDYHISIPQPMHISDSYPSVIRDFFELDFDFTFVDKKEHQKLPYIRIKVDDQDKERILDRVRILEGTKELDHLMGYGAGDKRNQVDDPDWVRGTWRYWMLYQDDKWHIDRSQFPELFEFLERNGINDLVGVTVGFLNSKGYIYPHIDPRYHGSYDGPCQFYVPLDFKPGNWLKLAGVGTFDTSKGEYAFNVCNFPHAAINDSDSDRTVLIIRCNVPEHLVVSE